MAFVKILPEYLETFSVALHPEVIYVSSSGESHNRYPGGSTGSMPLAARPSKCIKNIVEPSRLGQNAYDVENENSVSGFNTDDFSKTEVLNNINNTVIEYKRLGLSTDVSGSVATYMELVNSSSQIARNTKRFDIFRFDPPFTFNSNMSEKGIIRNILMTYYAPHYDLCEWGYTNYNSLNFYTASNVPERSAMLYYNLRQAGSRRPYSPQNGFTFDFHINPRYTNDPGEEFRAGTVLHVSSTYAVSIVSGTSKGGDGGADAFRIMVQLAHSTDIEPSKVDLNIANNKRHYPEDLIFLSDDNTLKKNHWHHVSIRWGTETFSDGTGSIRIDEGGSIFSFPSASILPENMASALVLGNYYSGWGDEGKFFNTSVRNEGVYPTENYGDPTITGPTKGTFDFTHPLNAEVHDVKVYDKMIEDSRVEINATQGSVDEEGLLFFVPPFFVKETFSYDSLITPFQTETKSTNHPFNTTFSFGVGGFLMNLQNHGREMIQGAYPRLYCLTASTIDTTVLDITANGYVYSTGSITKRNLTVLPCDDGKFIPDFANLLSGTLSGSMSQFRRRVGGLDLSAVNISKMIKKSQAYPGLVAVSAAELNAALKNETSSLPDDTDPDTMANQLAGTTPEGIATGRSGGPGPVLTIYQRTRDPSSNEICIFDISNLFYGNAIKRESFCITDANLTGSTGKIKVTLRDNGRGGLYRADALTPHPKWANAGTILYNEGIVVVKHPALSFFGKDEYETKFKGEQNLHLMTVNVPLDAGMFNSSSNPMYKVISASGGVNDLGEKFVYVSGMYLHDDNLNVIMRSNFAQPVKKRDSDSMLLRFKMDF